MFSHGIRRGLLWALVAVLLVSLTIPAGTLLASDTPWDNGHGHRMTWRQWLWLIFVFAPPNPCDSASSPVYAQSGDLFIGVPDLFADESGSYSLPTVGNAPPGRMPARVELPTQISRTYNSQDQRNGPLGMGWTFIFDTRCIPITDGQTEKVLVHWYTGRRQEFVKQPDGSYASPVGTRLTLSRSIEGVYTLTRTGDKLVYTFAPSGELSAITDPHGRSMAFAYDGGSGCLEEVTLPGDREYQIGYGANGKIATITDWAARTVQYDYDDRGCLTAVTDALGHQTDYGYDEAGRLTSTVNPLGAETLSVTYDEDGRVSRIIDHEGDFTYTYNEGWTQKHDNSTGGDWEYYFDSIGMITKRVDPLDRESLFYFDPVYNLTRAVLPSGADTEMTYDSEGNVLSKTDAIDRSTTYTYDADGNVETSTNPRGMVTRFEYDGNGQVTARHVAYGTADQASTTYAYDASGNMTRMEDPLGHPHIMEYDALGRVTRTENAVSGETLITYNGLGQVLTATSPDGSTTTYEYDALGRSTRMVDGSGVETTYGYDAAGSLTSRADGLGNATTFEHDALGRITSRSWPGGETSLMTYRADGKGLTHEDPLGHSFTRVYDLAGRDVGMDMPLDASTSAILDDNGFLQSLTDAENHTILEDYDDAGQLDTISDALGNTWHTEFDGAGNMTRRTDAMGRPTVYTYNLRNALTHILHPDASTTVLQRNLNDQITHVTAPGFSFTYEYDDLGRVTEITNDSNSRSYQYEYDGGGRVTRKTDPDSAVTEYRYDGAGRVTTVLQDGVAAQNNSYDAAGRLTQSTLGNGVIAAYGYDVNGNRAAELVQHGAQSLSIVANEYDALGRVTRVEQTYKDSSGQSNGTVARYTYDAHGRMDSETRKDSTESMTLYTRVFEYDKVGNRTQLTKTDGTVTTYAYDEAGRLTTETTTPPGGPSSTVDYDYDANGNLTREERDGDVVTYAYDFENRLIGVQTPDHTITHQLSPDGKRLATTIDDDTTSFEYDGLNVDREFLPDGTSIKYTLGRHVDAIIAFKHDTDPTYQYVTDRINSVLQLTDPTGEVVNSYDLEAFGDDYMIDETVMNPYRFTGRRVEAQGGLYYFREREYSPSTGRFTSLDPMEAFAHRSVSIGTLGARNTDTPASPLFGARLAVNVARMSTPNCYLYVGNSPSNHTDPTGEAILWNPASLSIASGCVGSACFGSGCVFSGCAVSACLGSGCGGSGCAGSGCVGSFCAASGCLDSVCIASGCILSVCGGSGCLGSACLGTFCGGSVCLLSGCWGSVCVLGSGCLGSACWTSSCQ